MAASNNPNAKCDPNAANPIDPGQTKRNRCREVVESERPRREQQGKQVASSHSKWADFGDAGTKYVARAPKSGKVTDSVASFKAIKR
jgi:hypothetical protein